MDGDDKSERDHMKRQGEQGDDQQDDAGSCGPPRPEGFRLWPLVLVGDFNANDAEFETMLALMRTYLGSDCIDLSASCAGSDPRSGASRRGSRAFFFPAREIPMPKPRQKTGATASSGNCGTRGLDHLSDNDDENESSYLASLSPEDWADHYEGMEKEMMDKTIAKVTKLAAESRKAPISTLADPRVLEQLQGFWKKLFSTEDRDIQPNADAKKGSSKDEEAPSSSSVQHKSDSEKSAKASSKAASDAATPLEVDDSRAPLKNPGPQLLSAAASRRNQPKSSFGAPEMKTIPHPSTLTPQSCGLEPFAIDRRVDIGAPVVQLSEHTGIVCNFLVDTRQKG
ncbi:unnamed protein product [Amoebophrya sp. A25]|nr:unnamed protein product [Amoebophrya sp. A25]|eukprot:GSA25T00002235001.1